MADLQRMSGPPQKAAPMEALRAVAQNKSTVVRVGAAAAGVGLLAVSVPVVMAAATAGAGILILGIMAVVGIGAMQALPLLGQKWENALLKARKAEARKNPVEQLENRYIAKKKKFEDFKGAMKIISAQINRLLTMIGEQERTDPGHNLELEKRTLEKMKIFHQRNLERGKQAEKALEAFMKAIERFRFQYEFAQQGKAVFASLKSAEGGDTEEEILSDTAINEIENQFDSIYGELEIESAFGQAKQIQSHPAQSTIEAEFSDLESEADALNRRGK